MKYKNTKTGAIIDSPCKISGGDWIEAKEEVKEPQPEGFKESKEVEEIEENEEIEEDEEAEKTEELDDGFDGITIKQIKQELDAFGIEYNPRAKKQELYDLMMQGR